MCCESVTGQRSDGLKDVPGLFSFHYWRSANLQAFVRFNRFACVSRFNSIETNSEVLMDTTYTKLNHPCTVLKSL